MEDGEHQIPVCALSIGQAGTVRRDQTTIHPSIGACTAARHVRIDILVGHPPHVPAEGSIQTEKGIYTDTKLTGSRSDIEITDGRVGTKPTPVSCHSAGS